MNELIQHVCNLIEEKDMTGPTSNGFWIKFEDDYNKYYIHHSNVCFMITPSEIKVLNIPNASEFFIKKCFFGMYCDIIENLLEVGEAMGNKWDKYISQILKITKLQDKRKETNLWKTLDIRKIYTNVTV